jgi:hypothetical protein
VLVEPNLLEFLRSHKDCPEGFEDMLTSRLLRDRDGLAFVHYLDEGSIEAHMVAVDGMRAASASANKLLEKYLWLVDYHNYAATVVGAGDPLLHTVDLGFCAV